MADETKNLDVIISAKDEASSVFTQAFSNLKEKARELNTEARESGDMSLERLLKGGGYLGIFTLAGDALKRASEESVKLSDELAKGKINAADVGLEILKSLPMIGGFAAAGESINELLTHQKRDIAEINEEIAESEKLMEDRVKVAHEEAKAWEEVRAAIVRAKEAKAAADAGAPGAAPGAQKAVEQDNQAADAVTAQKKRRDDDIKKMKDDEAKAMEDLRAKAKIDSGAAKTAAEANTHTNYNLDSSQQQPDREARIAKQQAEIDRQSAAQTKAAQDASNKKIADFTRAQDELMGTVRATAIENLANERTAAEKKQVGAFFEQMGKHVSAALSPHEADRLTQQTTEALARAKEDELRLTGHALEADLLQLKTAHEKRLEEIRVEAQKEVDARPAEAKKIRKEEAAANTAEGQGYRDAQTQAEVKDIEEKKKKLDEAQAESDRKAAESAAHHQQIQQTLHAAKIEMLEKEARLGDIAAGREAERLKIEDEYAQKKAEILKLAEGAGEADKHSLAAESDRLDRQKQSALAAQAMADLKPIMKAVEEPVKYAGFEDFKKTGGIMDAQRERDKKSGTDQVKLLADAVKHLAELNAKIPKIPEGAMSGGDGEWDSNLS